MSSLSKRGTSVLCPLFAGITVESCPVEVSFISTACICGVTPVHNFQS